MMSDTEIFLMMDELYAEEAFSCGTSAEEAEAILDDMEEPEPEPEPPLNAVCTSLLEAYAKRADGKPAAYPDMLQLRMKTVVLSDCVALAGGLLISAQATGGLPAIAKRNRHWAGATYYKLQITDQGYTASGTFCACDDYTFRDHRGHSCCKHLAALAARWLASNAS
jgi:hypothetical protein